MSPRRLKPEQVHRWLAAAHVVLSAEFGKDGYQGNERKYVLCSWIGRINILNITTQSSLQIQCYSYQNLITFFTEIEKKSQTEKQRSHMISLRCGI